MDQSLGVVIIGWIGTALTSIYILPQSIKVLVTKKTSDLSIWMLLLSTASTIVWTVWGVLTRQPNVYVTNIIHGSLVSIILVFKIRELIIKNKNKTTENLEEENQ